MNAKNITCSDCSKEYPLNSGSFRCPDCSGSLEVVMDYRKLRGLKRKRILSRPLNHSRYLDFFPVKKLVSIREGGTPLVRSQNIERKLNLPFELHFKYEAQNPTGSFKDRGSSVEIARAVETGAKSLICASTGNMGASVAAYASIANIPCSIFTPRDAVKVKIEQIMAYGAKVYHVAGDYSLVAKMVEKASKDYGQCLLGDYLWRREGTKSVGFEILDQLRNPDYIFSPIGNGTLMSATWKAVKEFKSLGWVTKRPKMVGVQASKCQPVCRAFRKNGKIMSLCGETIAVAIECGDPLDGPRALQAMKESGGECEAVTDRDILKARKLLAREEGLFAEPAGAVSLAGLIKARKMVKKGSRVVCLVTGHGLKTPATGIPGKLREIPGNMKALKSLF
jgi:threonine synthase